MKQKIDLEKELTYLGLLDKAREIYSELGDRAVLSYIRSSYRLLSKVYHPDLNPDNRVRAELTQQRLNRLSHLLNLMSDEALIDLIKKGIKRQAQRKKKILVVEDEVGLQELFRDILLIEGYDVSVAGDGAGGYEVYRQFRPDLVFADVVMPKMSGLELVRKIRDVNPRIKVIFVSGFFGIEQLKRELDAEILRYGYGTLSKPFKISEMLDLVGNYLRGFVSEPRGVNLYA
ncbi:MAG: response regulator [Deltaproteobacteria bacterium]|nr:response regulator [Deltaproteobacteria bacterium]